MLERVHIFPYTYYLVGRPGTFVRWLLGFVVGITLLILPLATLLVLQLWFLAYQDQAITWVQRVAVWFDVALVIALWPLIMDRRDSWRNYLSEVGDRLRHHWRIGLAWAMVWAGFVLPGFVTTNEVYFTALWAILVLLILLVATLIHMVRQACGRYSYAFVEGAIDVPFSGALPNWFCRTAHQSFYRFHNPFLWIGP